MMKKFEPGVVYQNVYFIFIDAAGHSNIVKSNPIDVSIQAFDLLYETIEDRLNRIVSKEKCEIAIVWSWLGDGGMIAIYDNSEETALNTTLKFVNSVIKLDLPHIKSEFENENINGELHIRIAVHKGTIRFTTEGQQGFIHSIDINWGSHLEKVTPPDSISISKEIFDIMPIVERNFFVPVGKFENRDVYLFTPNVDSNIVILNWIVSQGFNRMEWGQCYLERLSQKDKSRLIDCAKSTVIDFGTTLNTCSNYLFSTERPIPYRDAVIRLLKRGGKFICCMLSPDSDGSKQLVELRGEKTDEKLKASMMRFKIFKTNNSEFSKEFKVYQFKHNPNLAAMIIDPDLDNSVCLYSPYLSVLPESGNGTGRADMPHYLVSKKNNKMYDYIMNYVKSYIKNSDEFL